jgi:hypothetical protein
MKRYFYPPGRSAIRLFPARYFVGISVALILAYYVGLQMNHRQSAIWTAPFLSAAANLTYPPSFQIDQDEIARFYLKSTTVARDSYRFSPSTVGVDYPYNDIGYVYLVFAAATLFPFMGQQGSIILLQAVVHLVVCLTVVSFSATTKKWRRGFLLIYAINPLILLYVVYNHYYFWPVISSFLFFLLTHRKLNAFQVAILIATVLILPWSVMARSTAAPLLPLLLFLMFRRWGILPGLAMAIYVSACFFFFWIPSKKNPWHTAYIGVGAYDNPWHIELSDHAGLRLVNEQSSFSHRVTHLESPGVYATYRQLSKTAFIRQVEENPLLYAKNALFNGMLAFGVGYLTHRKDGVNYLLSATGLFAIFLHITGRQWLNLFAIFLASIAFIGYYPPIPAYLYGSYLLIVTGLLNVMYRNPPHSLHRKVLYLSLNDGSDTRINKEVASLISAGADVTFMGIGSSRKYCFVGNLSPHSLLFTKGSRKSVTALIRYFAHACWLLLRNRYHSIHVVNEPQLIALWPFLLLQRHVVVDVFDSLFLRKNLPGNQFAWLKQLVYLPADLLIVTDEKRWALSADSVKRKTRVLPNYPVAYTGSITAPQTPPMYIMYFGWLSKQRGSGLLTSLLATGKPLKILMAGWIADDETQRLTTHPEVSWLGTLSQQESLTIAATQSHYVLCVYAPVNANNRHASPNKVHDALQIEKPVLINAETAISEFVLRNRTGLVVPHFEVEDPEKLYQSLIDFLKTYHPNPDLKKRFVWEKVDYILLESHCL